MSGWVGGGDANEEKKKKRKKKKKKKEKKVSACNKKPATSWAIETETYQQDRATPIRTL